MNMSLAPPHSGGCNEFKASHLTIDYLVGYKGTITAHKMFVDLLLNYVEFCVFL